MDAFFKKKTQVMSLVIALLKNTNGRVGDS